MLNDLWRACQRSLILRQGRLLYLIASIAGSLCFLTQFIRFHELFFLFEISCIFSLKNSLLVIFTIFSKFFQSSNYLEFLYSSKCLWQILLHHDFECLVMLTIFECLNQISSVWPINSCIVLSRSSTLLIWLVLRLLTKLITSEMNFASLSLFELDMFFKNWDLYCKRDMAWWKSPLKVDNMIVKFIQSRL